MQVKDQNSFVGRIIKSQPFFMVGATWCLIRRHVYGVGPTVDGGVTSGGRRSGLSCPRRGAQSPMGLVPREVMV